MDALSGLILVLLIWFSFVMWVAKLQSPFFHLTKGSGQAVQYHPENNSEARLHPWHSSTVGWQLPPLKEQPFLVIKMHSNPSFTVVQTIGITPFPSDVIWWFCQSEAKVSAFLSTRFGLVNKIFGYLWQRYLTRPALFIKKSLVFELRTYWVASFLHMVWGWAPAKTEPLLCLTNIHDKFFSVLENPVLWAGSESIGSALNSFRECWSTGVPESNGLRVFFHYSNTPSLQKKVLN